MGASAPAALGPVWKHFVPIIARNLAGELVEEKDTPLFFVRAGFLEETYFSLKFMPIFDANGVTVGHYESLNETVR